MVRTPRYLHPFLALVLTLVLMVPVVAQTIPVPPPPPAVEEPTEEPFDESTIISVDVSLVNVMATVHGRRGALIGNLEQSDFRLFEDGEEQEIRYFSRETDLPLTIALLVDVSGSQEGVLPETRRAASQFFEKVLRQQDLAFVMGFGKDAELMQDITGSARLLQEGLDALELSVAVGGYAGRPGPVPTLNQPAGTVLYDAVFLAAEERLKQEVGRKVIVVISDGADTGSKVKRNEAIEAAHKADAAIYSIFYADRRFQSDEGTLKRLSEETGGGEFRVDRPRDLDAIFAQIEEEMRSQYAIGYSPTNPVKDGSFRELEFKMANKDYKVQARKGYYATDEGF